MKIFLGVLVFILAGAYALVGKQCQSEADCDDGECCQILSPYQVASKKRAVLANAYPTNGTCQLYKVEGQYCDSFEKINGYCSCGPGLYCHSYTQPIADGKRGAPFVPPGYEYISQCEQEVLVAGRDVSSGVSSGESSGGGV